MANEGRREGRTYEKTGTATTKTSATVDAVVTRGLNDTRLAVLGIMVTIALTVAFGVQEVGVEYRVLLGVGVLVAIALLTRLVLVNERATHVLMTVMHWVLGSKH